MCLRPDENYDPAPDSPPLAQGNENGYVNGVNGVGQHGGWVEVMEGGQAIIEILSSDSESDADSSDSSSDDDGQHAGLLNVGGPPGRGRANLRNVGRRARHIFGECKSPIRFVWSIMRMW